MSIEVPSAHSPAPVPSSSASSLSPPSSIFGQIESSFPVTKFITLGIFIAGILGFLVVGVCLIFHFYKRRFNRDLRAMEAAMAAGTQPRKMPAIYEGFIVSNPCGGEQVAYKMENGEDGDELREITVVKSADELCSGSSQSIELCDQSVQGSHATDDRNNRQ